MIKKISIRSAVFLFSFLPISLWAEAPVTDAVPSSSSNSNSSFNSGNASPSENSIDVPLSQDNGNSSSMPASSSPTSILSKLNEQQREIQRLRGQLEVQSHELSQLKTQQQAYYNDLDQRITLLSSGKGKTPSLSLDNTVPESTAAASAASTAPPTSSATMPAQNTAAVQSTIAETTPGTAPTAVATTATTNDSEESSYNAAYSLIESKKFTEAGIAMKAFIQKFPTGKYVANAHYWLGELLLAQHQDKASIDEFNTVIRDYPTSNKISASMLKLGFAYENLGDTAKAKTTFLEVEQKFPGTTTAQLAHARLESLS